MAKPSVSTPPPASQAAQAIVNQVLDASKNGAPASDDQSSESMNIEKEIGALVRGSDMAALLKRATAAKPEEFTKPELDFWKPNDPGAPTVLTGVYLASAKSGRLIQHAFLIEGKAGPLVMRVNGAHGLTRQILNTLEPKDICRIEYKGQTGTMNGNKFGQWTVSKLS